MAVKEAALSAAATSPGRALSQRLRLESAIEDLVVRMTVAYLDRAELAARKRLTMLESLNSLTAAGEDETTVEFMPGSLEALWQEVVENFLLHGADKATQFLPEPFRTYARRVLSVDKFTRLFEFSLADVTYDIGQDLFARRAAGELTLAQVAKELTKAYSLYAPDGEPSQFGWRAQRLSRTVSTNAYNTSMIEQLRADGYTLKLWVAHHDERTRHTHMEADGQAVALDSPFTVGTSAMQYPGDFDAPISEWINCRCVLVGETGDPTTSIDWDSPVITEAERIAQGLEPISRSVRESIGLAASGNPTQARAPQGTPIGGRWIITPGGMLDRITAKAAGVPEEPIGATANRYLPNRVSIDEAIHSNDYLWTIAQDPGASSAVAAATREHITKAIADGVHIDMHEAAVHQVLMAGKVKNLHMLHHYEVPGNRNSDYYRKLRRTYENDVMGLAPDAPVEEKPVYGYGLWNREVGGYYYGDYTLKLKTEKVIDRTTWTIGDSMDNSIRPLTVEEVATGSNEGLVASSQWAAGIGEAWEEEDFDSLLGIVNYTEAQVHGGVTVDDIESIIVESLADVPVVLADRALSAGIPIIERESGYSFEDYRADESSGLMDTVPGASLVSSGATFANNPSQARAPKGTPIGGRWIDTPTGMLRSLSRLGAGRDVDGADGLTEADRTRRADEILAREKRPSVRATADRLLDIYDRTTPAQRAAGAIWYEEAQGVAQSMVDDPATDLTLDQAAAVLAHTSVRTRWDVNVATARAIAHGATTADEVRLDFERQRAEGLMKVGGMVLGANVAAAVNAANHPDPIGLDNTHRGTFSEGANKTRTFASNILGDRDGVTVDTWMYRALGHPDTLQGKIKGTSQVVRADQVYESLSQAVRVAAEERGIDPVSMQGATWLWTLDNYKRSKGAGGAEGYLQDKANGDIIPLTLTASAGFEETPLSDYYAIDPEPVPDYWYAMAQKLAGVTFEEEPPALLASGPDQARAPRGTDIGGQWIQTASGHWKSTKDVKVNEVPGAYRVPWMPNRIGPLEDPYAGPFADMDPDERTELADVTRSVLIDAAQQDITVTVFPDALEAIVKDGRFKPAHELASEGDFHKGMVYMMQRDAYETNVMGVDPEMPLAAHPISGWAVRDGSMDTAFYGTVDVVLKPEVRERTSYTIDDSLNLQSRPLMYDEMDNASEEELLASSHWALSREDPGQVRDYWQDGPDMYEIGYIETQTHGGITLGDIAEVHVRSKTDYDTTTIEALEAAGIAIFEDHVVDFI